MRSPPTRCPLTRPRTAATPTPIRPEAERYGLDLPGDDPREDDDHWADKVALLIADPVPLVSFTFGFPDSRVVAALHRAGSVVAMTVTSAQEARGATEAGADLLVVQASAAGAHSGRSPRSASVAGPARHAASPGPGRDHGATAGRLWAGRPR